MSEGPDRSTPTTAIPIFVSSDEDLERWVMCEALACELLEEPPASGQVWSMARVLFKSEIPL